MTVSPNFKNAKTSLSRKAWIQTNFQSIQKLFRRFPAQNDVLPKICGLEEKKLGNYFTNYIDFKKSNGYEHAIRTRHKLFFHLSSQHQCLVLLLSCGLCALETRLIQVIQQRKKKHTIHTTLVLEYYVIKTSIRREYFFLVIRVFSTLWYRNF